MPEDLWGELPDASKIRTPQAILLEQGEVLAQKTKGLLVGRVSRSASGSEFKIHFSITAPSLSYSQVIMIVEHPVSLYPMQITNLVESEYYEVSDEAQFVGAIREILSSPAIKRVIGGLMAQINADPKSS
jgi:hypothetical protein